MSEFEKSKPHDENIKVSIEKILGAPAVLKRPKKTAQDRKKNLFMSAIDTLIALDVREVNLDRAFYLDLNKYNDPFYSTINDLLCYSFSKDQVRLIYFFLYERISEDGHIVDIRDYTDRILDLSTTEKLYEEVLKLK